MRLNPCSFFKEPLFQTFLHTMCFQGTFFIDPLYFVASSFPPLSYYERNSPPFSFANHPGSSNYKSLRDISWTLRRWRSPLPKQRMSWSQTDFPPSSHLWCLQRRTPCVSPHRNPFSAFASFGQIFPPLRLLPALSAQTLSICRSFSLF